MSEFPCPSCRRSFDTSRGLSVHHSHIHNERLSNRECNYCGQDFYCDYKKAYCSEECLENGKSVKGKDNPNYRAAKETGTCNICDTVFEFYPSEKKGLYCPRCVKKESWRSPPSLAGENNPHWGEGKREKECHVCGDEVSRHPSGFTGKYTFCGRECQYKWLSEYFTGEGHPNWKQGESGAYGKGWARIRQKALERDEYQCSNCGISESELGRNPDVHHIFPVRFFADCRWFNVDDPHFLENVISLCPSCHRKAEFETINPANLWNLINE